MRPELKRMNERLAYFLTQMDLENSRTKHAEQRIAELERELKGRVMFDNVRLTEIKKLEAENIELKEKMSFYNANGREWIKKWNEANNAIDLLKYENNQMRQSIQAENDRLERNENLEKENARLMIALRQMQRERDEALADKDKYNFYKAEACKLEGIYREMDELRTSKEDTERKNAKLADELVEIQEVYNDLEQAHNTLKEGYHELVLKYEETQRICRDNYCNCGAIGYLRHNISGKCYCVQCFKIKDVKL